ncbi:N-acetyl-gamma-glutamyl-phosphate reductase [bacterium]|nr:N-acetyl-gamma-glutamyl-phosphate reductase [bacterium]|tara:strand:+ start:903 stop:1907 length:1005 start_codon:yes stop_codon:yes gene_type:complete
MLKVAILGASGFTGFECIRLLQAHPNVVITHLFSLREPSSDINTYINTDSIPNNVEMFNPQTPYDIDCLIIALPHTHVFPIMPELIAHSYKIIDLSADFRLTDGNRYDMHYHNTHTCKDILDDSVYGLNEFYGTDIKKATLVANPGCYAIATILALKPLTDKSLINHVTIDAKSGVSGAGKAMQDRFLYANANEHLSAYQVNSHRHMAEFEENCPCSLTFTPHLVPMNRGILIAAYIDLTQIQVMDSLFELYQSHYESAPFVTIEANASYPSTQAVVGSNMVKISICQVNETRAIVMSTIDNLIKGAAGNAIQSMNLMFGFSETLGLPLVAQRV